MNENSSGADPFNELAHEFAQRYRRGEHPSLTEYTQKYPELAEQIRELFPTLMVIEEFGSLVGQVNRPLAAQAVASSTSHQLGEYRILREIARGGMGIVYEAVQESLGRHVALKVLAGVLHRDQLERFRREARAAAKLHHTNIVPVFSVGEHQGVHYYAMQFIHGQNLEQVLRQVKRLRDTKEPGSAEPVPAPGLALSVAQGMLSGHFLCQEQRTEVWRPAGVPEGHPSQAVVAPGSLAPGAAGGDPSEATSAIIGQSEGQYFRSVAQVGVQVAEALIYVHGQGVLHRDIKPANLLLDTQGVVWVTDFGLARVDGSDELTDPGDIIGTLRYLAPERFQRQADPRSDVFGLGLTLYEMATLSPVYQVTERAQVIEQILHQEPRRPSSIDPSIPHDLETIILKAMAKEPAQRYQSAEELAQDLHRFLADRPILARRSSLWEHAWRWCRRNPPLAVSLVTVVLTFVLGFVGVTWKWQEAEQARQNQRVARQEADDRAAEIRRGLEQLKLANTLLDRGRNYIHLLRWDDANEAFTRAIALRPEHRPAWEARTDLYTQLGLWDLAAADCARVAELEPEHCSRYYFHALLRCWIGDIPGYHLACKQLRERFEGTVYGQAGIEQIRTHVLGPDPSTNANWLVELGENILTSERGIPWYHYVVGIAHYRAGHYEQAIHRLRESLDMDPNWPARGINYPVLAMAHHRLGQEVEARQALQEADRFIKQWTREWCANPGENWVIDLGATSFGPGWWFDWLECQLYYREAKLLIEGSAPANDPYLRVLRARAFAGLRKNSKAEIEYTAALKLLPDDPQVRLEAYRNRAYLFIRDRDWGQVAKAFAQASELGPNDLRLWQFRAISHLAAGDVPAYRKACATLVKRFGKTDDPGSAFQVVYACVLRDDALPDMSQLTALAQIGKPFADAGHRGLGAALYRAGRYDEAVRCLETGAKFYLPRAWDWCFLAMAHARLGQRQQAQRCLARANSWMDRADRAGFEDSGRKEPSWANWHEPIICALLRREAESLLQGKGTSSNCGMRNADCGLPRGTARGLWR
jgi:serine/threonine protein kinase/Flp pilus assembly protein TadD